MNDEITRPGGPVLEVNGKGRLRCAKVRSGVSTLREILPAFMTIPEVAHRLNVCEKTVRRLVDRQILPRCRHLGKVLIPRDAVEKWIVESTRN
jgi:excisionase family DNA binding protein